MNNQLNIFHVQRPVFFNTIGLSGSTLIKAKKCNKEQDQRVLELFREFRKMTPLAAWRAYCRRFPPAPATSIRRSINTLTGLNLLRMLGKEEQVMEEYGKPNNQWEVI